MKTPLPSAFTAVCFVPAPDALVGFPVLGAYTEQFWTPSLGPTAVLAWRRLLSMGDGPVDLIALYAELGVARHRALHSFDRLIHARMAAVVGESGLSVAGRAPRLPGHLVARLPERLRLLHASFAASIGSP